MFPLIFVWISDGVNDREAGDLRRHRGHYDVNVMWLCHVLCIDRTVAYFALKKKIVKLLHDDNVKLLHDDNVIITEGCPSDNIWCASDQKVGIKATLYIRGLSIS